jgi:hypothetical protein
MTTNDSFQTPLHPISISQSESSNDMADVDMPDADMPATATVRNLFWELGSVSPPDQSELIRIDEIKTEYEEIFSSNNQDWDDLTQEQQAMFSFLHMKDQVKLAKEKIIIDKSGPERDELI